jgi:hypothetical protein
MPTRKVNLTDHLDKVVLPKFAALRTAIDEGDASGVAAGNPFDRVRRAIKLPIKKR